MADREPPPKPTVRVPTIGRPTLYDPATHPALVIELGSQGMSDTEIANEMDIDRATLRDWAQRHPEFSTALTRARQASLTWWETAQRTGYAQHVIGAQVYKLAVTNRFKADYSDMSKVEQTTRDGDKADIKALSDEGLDAELAKLHEARAERERVKAEALKRATRKRRKPKEPPADGS